MSSGASGCGCGLCSAGSCQHSWTLTFRGTTIREFDHRFVRARAARTSDGRSIIEWRKHVVRLKHEPGLLPLPAPPTCPRPTSARHRLLGRESIGSCRSHSTFGPGLKNVAATTTTRMTADHTASLEESNAARLPLGYRDSCSAYVPFFMFSCSH